MEFISSVRYTNESNPIIQSNMLIEECGRKGVIAERLYGEKKRSFTANMSKQPLLKNR